MDDNNKETFSYTYSAEQQEEIKKIRQKYLPEESDKMAQLRKLDRNVTRKGMAVSISVGVVGALLLGVGMCCTMVWADSFFVLGIIVGIIGIGAVSAAYPLFTHITKKEREKIAPEIIRLTDELMK
ncbi:MAG: hypothetical protein ACI4K7_03555 [Oscillospiraceae bacterium]